mmetsp:Transcript_3541/g.4691  ORF Transcript_3541/g.4691 Transcript_3541/m.4691 type:complete len:284 (+) Transcript_3541:83-934(+)
MYTSLSRVTKPTLLHKYLCNSSRATQRFSSILSQNNYGNRKNQGVGVSLLGESLLPVLMKNPCIHNMEQNSKSFSTLSDVLQREIDEETENELNEMPSDLAELKESLSEYWTIVDGKTATSTNGGATVKMYKKENLSNGSKVTLSFHCQDSLNPEELGFFDNAVEAVSGGDDDSEEESVPFKFDVTIGRAGKIMYMSCTSEAAEASIDGIMIGTSEDDIENGDVYRGPMIEDLAEDVKEGLDTFLIEDCGVNEDVAAFIAMYADYREQMEYFNWLKNVKDITG